MEGNNKTSNRQSRSSSGIWIGVIFIVGGIVVLLNQLDVLPFELNWWALFIMMPAAGFLTGAYNRFRFNNNVLSTDVLVPALIGLFMVALAVSLLVGGAWNINWSMFWPIMLILIGLGMILGRSQKR